MSEAIYRCLQNWELADIAMFELACILSKVIISASKELSLMTTEKGIDVTGEYNEEVSIAEKVLMLEMLLYSAVWLPFVKVLSTERHITSTSMISYFSSSRSGELVVVALGSRSLLTKFFIFKKLCKMKSELGTAL